MKKLILLAFVILSLGTIQSKAATEFGGDGYFYTALSPYGEWIELNDGMTVWRPIMMPSHWAPYTIGNWEWTSDGWYWNSDEPFGYITYHYGRWYNDDYYGWIWIPDDQWAPAWVEWRYDDDYVGWAPLSPYGEFLIGTGLHFTNEYHPPYGYWNFVTYNHFCDNNVYNYYAGPTYKYRIYNGTRFRTDYDYSNGRVINRGVGYDLVRERSGRPIRTREIVRVTDPREVIRNTDKSVIRTYVATRQDISRDNIRDITIKRPERKTTMDVSKINIGERNISGRNDVIQQRQNPVVDRNTESQKRDLLDQQNRQKQQQMDQLNRQKQQDVQRQQQVDQQNKQKQQVQQRQQVDQQNRQKQQVQQRQQVDQQNRQKQQVQQRQQVVQQNRQKQQVQQRQQVDQQNRQKQQVQQRQNVDQQNRQKQQVEQKKQQTDQRNQTKDNGKDRK
jgi:hypothetical protein